MTIYSVFVFSQKKKSITSDITSNIEVRVLGMKAFGNNIYAKGFENFYGFGFGGQLMTPINWGIGLDYNLFFSDVKLESKNLYGNLGSQNLSEITLYIIHRNKISEDISIEETGGFSLYTLSSFLTPGKEKYKESNGGFNLGIKGIFSLDRDGYQQFLLGIKGNVYFSDVYNENSDIKKYYSKAIFIGLNFGYRYNF